MNANHEQDVTPLTWSETRSLMRADYERLETVCKQQGRDCQNLRWSPSYIAVYLFRVSHFLYRNNRRLQARLIWHLNQLVTGADISEPADIGPGLVLLHPVGVALMCKAGKNFTLSACAGVGGEIGRDEDIGAGPGLAIIGDNVSLGAHSGILGPVRVGDNVSVKSGAVVVKSVDEDSVVNCGRMLVIKRGAK